LKRRRLVFALYNTSYYNHTIHMGHLSKTTTVQIKKSFLKNFQTLDDYRGWFPANADRYFFYSNIAFHVLHETDC